MATITDINILTRFLCDATSTQYTDANLLITTNQAYEETDSDILKADGRWQFDDSNFTTFPIATTTLISGQKDYSFDVSLLRILKVEVMDKNGKYYIVNPIDFRDISGSITEYQSTSGAPQEYDVQGSSIVLYPAPDNGVSVTLAAGLKVYFQRTADIFTSAQVSTGTKVPGFASPFHNILSYKAAIPFCIKYKPERVAALESKVERMRQEMIDFYSHRDKDEVQALTMAPIRHR